MTTKGSSKLKAAPVTVQEMKDFFDEDGVFTFDQDHLAQCLKNEFKLPNAKDMAKGFFRIADPHGDGWVDVEDFLEEYIRMQLFRSIRAIINNHEIYDTDKDGHISKQELKEVLSSQLGATDADRMTEKCFRAMDKDNSGDLSQQELKDWYAGEEESVKKHRKAINAMDKEAKKKKRDKRKKQKEEVASIAKDCFEEMPPGTELSFEELTAVWDKYDKDQSGRLDKEEMQNVLDDLFLSLQGHVGEHVRATLKAAGVGEDEIKMNIDEAVEKLQRMDTKKLASKFIKQMGGSKEVSQEEFLEQFQVVLHKAQRPLRKKQILKRAKTLRNSNSSSVLAPPSTLPPMSE